MDVVNLIEAVGKTPGFKAETIMLALTEQILASVDIEAFSSQEQFARNVAMQTGTSIATINKFFACDISITLIELVCVAKAFDTTLKVEIS